MDDGKSWEGNRSRRPPNPPPADRGKTCAAVKQKIDVRLTTGGEGIELARLEPRLDPLCFVRQLSGPVSWLGQNNDRDVCPEIRFLAG